MTGVDIDIGQLRTSNRHMKNYSKDIYLYLSIMGLIELYTFHITSSLVSVHLYLDCLLLTDKGAKIS